MSGPIVILSEAKNLCLRSVTRNGESRTRCEHKKALFGAGQAQRGSPDPHRAAHLLALFILAAGVRLLYIASLPPDAPIASVDAWGYHRLALNLAAGNGFSLHREAPFLPDSVRTPLYPLFLLLVRRALGPAPRTAAAVQALLDGLTTLLTCWLATRLAQPRGQPATHNPQPATRNPQLATRNPQLATHNPQLATHNPQPATQAQRGSPDPRRAGRVAALLYALNPTQVRYVNDLLAETLLSFLLTLCACALVRYVQEVDLPCRNPVLSLRRKRSDENGVSWPWLLLLALLTGLAILCKPNVQFLPLIWIAAIALARGRHGPRTQAAARTQAAVRTQAAARTQPAVRVLAAAGTLALAVSFLLLPWAARNRLVFGRWFLSTAFEGNVSRVSAPATLAAARGGYAIPWSAEWEGLFGQIVSQAAARYNWSKPWDALTARELDAQNHQVYLVARQVLLQHPLAWVSSHLQGMGRYLEPQTYKVCYARFAGTEWPPDILDDAVIHVGRAIGRGDWAEAGRIVVEERGARFDALRAIVWWGTFAGQLLGLVLMLRGAWRLLAAGIGRQQPALVAAILLAIGSVLLVPGPIAYERFRVPVTGMIVALIAANLT